jgi:hypothetical protein
MREASHVVARIHIRDRHRIAREVGKGNVRGAERPSASLQGFRTTRRRSLEGIS